MGGGRNRGQRFLAPSATTSSSQEKPEKPEGKNAKQKSLAWKGKGKGGTGGGKKGGKGFGQDWGQTPNQFSKRMELGPATMTKRKILTNWTIFWQRAKSQTELLTAKPVFRPPQLRIIDQSWPRLAGSRQKRFGTKIRTPNPLDGSWREVNLFL